MAETEKILIEVEIDNEAARKAEADLIGLIERERQELALKRKELKKSNGTNKEAAKRIGELTRQIASNTTQLRNEQKAIKANDNSINGLRASVSELTAERNNLDTSSKEGIATFRQLTAQIKDQTDQLKELEGEVGDFRRNVGDYTNSMKEAIQATTGFGGGLDGLGAVFQSAKAGLKGLTLGFKGLKGAIVATGIGALIVVLGSLITFLTKTKKGVQIVERAMGALKGVVNALIDSFASIGETIFETFSNADKIIDDFVESISNPKQILIDLGNAIKDNVLNRFRAMSVFIEAISLAFEGEWAAAAKKATDAAIQLGTGVTDATDKIIDVGEAAIESGNEILNYGNSLFKAAEDGAALVKMNQDLAAVIRQQTVEAAKGELQAEKNRKLRDDERKSLEERLEFNRLAGEGELKRLDAERTAAQARLQILQNNRVLNRQFNDETLQEEKDLEAELLRIQADYEGRSTEILTNANSLRKEQAEKDKAARVAQEQADREEREQWVKDREAKLKESLDKRKAAEQAWTDFQKQEAERRNKIDQEQAKTRISTAQQVSAALGAAQSQFEEGTAAFKAFAIIRASIDTYLAANNALATLPPPASFIAAGTTIATGLLNVSKIAGFAQGGIVGGGIAINRSNGDNRLITAKTGEAILNRQQQARIGHGNLAAAGVPGFATGGVVGSQLQASSISSDVRSQQGIIDQIANIPPPVLDFKEFTRFQNRVSLKESRANV